jgi:hypothetical protein
MKKILLITLLLMPFWLRCQVQTNTQLNSQINTDIRGKTFDSKRTGNMFKTTIDSKVALRNDTLLISGTTYTLQLTDEGKDIYFTNSTSLVTVTLPNGLPQYYSVMLNKIGTSDILLVATSGNLIAVNDTITNQGAFVEHLGGNTWNAVGGLGSVVAGGGGGITNGAANNELMKSDGTNAVSSGFFSSALGDFDLGNGLAGSVRTISAQGSATNVGLNLFAKNSGTVTIGGGIINLNHLTGSYVQVGSAGSAGTIAGYYPDVFTVRGSNETDNSVNATGLTLQGGDWSTGNNQGTNVLIKPGLNSGSGATGAIYQNGKIAFFTTLVSNWQGMENGLFIANRVAAPITGIANGIALHAADVNSSSELFLTTESGAEVNISGLAAPVVLSGTTLTLTEAHRGKIIYTTNSSAITITVPAALPLGWNCVIMQDGTGTVSIITSGGATVNGKIATAGQYDMVSLLNYKGTDVYIGR